MPYLVASILAITSALIILFTRYEADDSTIMSQIEKMKTMISMVDGFVNTYVDSGGVLSDINFQVLDNAGILINVGTVSTKTRLNPSDGTGSIETTMRLPSDNVIWHLIPNKDDGSSYKLLVDMRGDSSLMSKAIFSESFIGKEYCEKMLFGTVQRTQDRFNGVDDFENTGTNSDGIFVCEVYK